MKQFMKFIMALVLGMQASSLLAAPSPVTIYGEASYDGDVIYLDIFADVYVPLRSFGVKVEFEEALVQPVQVGAYSRIWFLASQPGQNSNYTSASLEGNTVRIVGGRFDGTQPDEGIMGTRLLLGTIQFLRTAGQLPESFGLFPSGPAEFAGFVSTAGDNLDDEVVGFGESSVSFGVLPLDEDDDLLLDAYEWDQFKSLDVADGSTDSDGDGTTDADELYQGTDPQDPDDETKVRLSVGNDGVTVEWEGQSGRFYDLLWTNELDMEFQPLAVGIAPSTLNLVFDDEVNSNAFYRLDIHNPSWH